jgi:two-component system CheB/CheR fusion protein
MTNVVPNGQLPLPSLHVLVVDDRPDARESLALLVTLNGHTVSSASNGTVALELARRQPPDVAFLDIGLPDIDGYEIARRLLKLGCPRRPLLVAVTGYGQPGDRARSRAAGFDLHLIKPVDPSVLESILRAVAKLRRPGATGHAKGE